MFQNRIMKKIVLLCALPALLIGCVPKSELEKAKSDLAAAQARITSQEQELQTAKAELSKHPSEFVGTWRCQTTTLMAAGLLGNTPHANDITLALDGNGQGSLSWLVDKMQADSAGGPWTKAGDFIIVDRSNSGFAAFKVASKSETKMTVLNRAGLMLEFTKIK
jgi:hypothetical protein